MKTTQVISLVLLFVCVIAAQQPPVTSRNTGQPKASVKLAIEKIEPTQFGYDVSVRVTNSGNRPLTFALATPPSGMALQSLNVQQWDNSVGWESAGSCRDVPPSATMTLPPNSAMWQTVPIFDANKIYATAVCPRKIRGLRGRVRAVLYFAFNDHVAFESHKPALQNVVSEAVELPRLRDSQE